MKIIALILLVAGAVIILFSMNMPTTVEVPSPDKYTQVPKIVNNVGLMNDKQNTLILGGILCIIGAILYVGSNKQEQFNPDVRCPYCNSELELSAEEIAAKDYICCVCSKHVTMLNNLSSSLS